MLIDLVSIVVVFRFPMMRMTLIPTSTRRVYTVGDIKLDWNGWNSRKGRRRRC